MRLTDSALARFRLRRHLTQSAASQALGVSFDVLAKWEQGVHAPSPVQIEALALFYGTTIRCIEIAVRRDQLRYIRRLSRQRRLA